YEAALAQLEEMELRPVLARGQRFFAGFLRRLGDDKRARELDEKGKAFLRQIGAADAEEVDFVPAAGPADVG
ncbi:MAG: hypothetical protein V3T44_07160, partial [bacterium]